ncbi:ferrous iron transport protein A [Pseudenhygromyxa sp. WMMC2535]|uniref:FeoA family protein n=1 Tax=Pseudenhygromyxa sp. WMMC2535 TaxID=2712867 RepID=UPI00155674DD|nr:FeoA family protein [Pseudenhygromyxa sp. WMMC2535]NVB38139.1 ferrous iron transport protein A [Pseudenhygromyxa sp. WMMC2535]
MSFQSTLADLDIGQEATVRTIEGRGPMTVRLLEMGFVPGVEVALVKRAPLGDPLELRLRGYHVSLRRAEARLISTENPGARPSK